MRFSYTLSLISAALISPVMGDFYDGDAEITFFPDDNW
jgi:hypothetical protein